jgi:non-specific serine/threonine protein kinase/serine/threonine-protein kinase
MQLNPRQAAKLADELLDLCPGENSDSTGSSGELAGVRSEVAASAGGMLGNYRVSRLVGVGGMGEVYEAEQENPRRRVALKIVRGNRLTPELRRRFEHEVRILASLQHPGIAQIYEAGSMPGETRADGSESPGAPYFAMEFIEGEPLTSFAASRSLPVPDRLELFLRVCQAVEHAHQKGVIHRDLKPANILVAPATPASTASGSTLADTLGQPKVLDFGVARATDGDLTLTSVHTEIGKLVGTLPYMSPEQADGDPASLDTRSDVYALGVVLYELLSGKLPYEVKGDAGARVANALRVIREVDPTPLSSVDRVFRGDLDTIVGKALEKDRDRRYQSVGELAGDIRRYLHDQPIVARRASAWYELQKFARRNRGMVASIGATGTSLVVCLVVAVVFGLRELRHAGDLREANAAAERAATDAEEQARRATENAKSAEGVIDFVTAAIAGVEPGKGGPAMTLRDLLDATAAELREGGPSDANARASIEATIGAMYLALQKTSEAVEFLRTALGVQEEALGADSTAALKTLHSLCKAERASGHTAEARALAQVMVERGTRVYGEDSAYVMAARNILVNCLQDEQKFGEARAEIATLLERAAAVHGESSAIALVLLGTSAQLAHMTGDVNSCARLWERYLRLDPEGRIAGWRPTIVAKAQLAQAYSGMGKARQAEPLFRQALDSQRQEQGVDHTDTLKTQAGLGVLLSRSGRRQEGEDLLRGALELFTRSRGADDPNTLVVAGSLGDALVDSGKYDEAEPLLRETLAGFTRVREPMHRDIQVTQGSLAYALSKLGRHQEAEALSLEVLRAIESKHGASSLLTIRARNNYAVILANADRVVEAETAYLAVLEALVAMPDPPLPGVVAAQLNLGTCQRRQKKFEEAESNLRKAYETASGALPPSHPTTLTIAQELEALYRAWGKEEQAREWSERVGSGTPGRPSR